MIYPDALNGLAVTSATTTNLTCPKCGRDGSFSPIGVSDVGTSHHLLQLRRCPNTKCAAIVYVVHGSGSGAVDATYPALRIDFDATDIPEEVVASFEEAITCHASGCHVAAAIMVRRTLEAICEHSKADGHNLKQRIRSLGQLIVIPQQLLDGMDELRLLGNDAAHIEAQIYASVGKVELEVAIRFAKEILKAVYQYNALLRELRALKTGNLNQSPT